MDDRERIEEAHGLWEIAIVRVATFAEAGASSEQIKQAIEAERSAFEHWKTVSRKAIDP